MKILIADDCVSTRATIKQHVMDWGHDAVLASHGVEALDALMHDDLPRLLLLDWTLPHMDGVTVCRRVRQSIRDEYVYIIMLTTDGNREQSTEALDAGADEFIAKPLDCDVLKQRVAGGQRIVELYDRLAATKDRLRVEASRDELTGAWNRGAICDLLSQEIYRSTRTRRPVSLLLVDIDGFKSLNDQHGHLSGDLMLTSITERLTRSVRCYDSVGRFDGDKLALILPETDNENALRVAERLRMRIEERPIEAGELKVPVTVSIGVASLTGGTRQAEQLILEADQALYVAKRGGRNQVRRLADLRGHATPALTAVPAGIIGHLNNR